VRAARDAWFGRFAGVPLDRLVFLDEFGATTQMQRTHGRAPPGERVAASMPHGHWKVVSTVAAMTARGVLCSASFDAATDAELFVTFVREALVPLLARRGRSSCWTTWPRTSRRRSAAWSSPRGRRCCCCRRTRPPDLNPIEMAISKVKAVLRKLARRTVDALFDAIGEALASVTSDDARNYIAHCGYAATT